MEAGDGGVFGGVYQGGADLREAVGRNAHADAAGANEDAKIRLARDDFIADLGREVRVIHGFRGEDAEIRHGKPFAGEVGVDGLFQLESAVVGGDGDAK